MWVGGTLYKLKAWSARYHKDILVEIKKKGYTGTSTTKRIGSGKIVLNKEESEGKIKAATLDLCLESNLNFEFADFFTLAKDTFQANLIIDGISIFKGYIVGDEYSEPYKAPPYDISVVATDGLALLTGYDFALTGMVTRLEAIRYILKFIDYENLLIAISVDLFEMRNDESKSFFDQIYFDAQIFAGLTCYEALENLLPFGCTITQADLMWFIRRDGDEAKTHFVYNYDYDENKDVLFGTIPGETVKSLGTIRTGDVYPISTIPTMNFEHSKKRCKVVKKFGVRESIFKNYDFSRQFDYWTWNNLLDVSKINDYSDYSAALVGGVIATSQTNNHYVRQTVAVHNPGAILFSFEYGFRGYDRSRGGSGFGDGSIPLSFKWQLKFVTETDVKYLQYDEDQETWWFANPIKINTQTGLATVFTKNFFEKFEVKVEKSDDGYSKLTDNGYFELTFWQIVYNANSTAAIEGYELRNVLLKLEAMSYFDDPEETTVAIRDEALVDAEDVELIPVDLPSNIPSYERRTGDVTYVAYDGDLYFDNGNYVDIEEIDVVGSIVTVSHIFQPATKWKNNGVENLTEIEVLQAEFYKHAFARQKLSGTFRGENFTLNSIFAHALNYNRQFYVVSGSWRILEDEFDIVSREIPGTATGNQWILENGTWNDAGEWIDSENWNDEDPELSE